ncbi:DUF4125 family protein [Mesoterricola silvestris]|uniref:DUF4125 family protein n=1 Tax=Mesoterricola silvestris TaxID=2927979 RepID=A0AA48KAT7_9BACT|nr:DUF4125 family protein [Mesoterricola silvestris]BDU71828.1 hypothetical protein METEAL_10020 [Mesoterricola silvestris]
MTANLIDHIIDLEWTMFHSVKASEPAACQEAEGTFRTMRRMSHSVLPPQVLEPMAAQLEAATAQGRNLMTEKYARMANQIPPLSDSPLIAEVVAAEEAWMLALNRRYPLTFPGKGDAFRTYLEADLETYAPATLEAYAACVREALAAGRNLVEERFANLFRRMGYADIEAREAQTRLQAFKCCQ